MKDNQALGRNGKLTQQRQVFTFFVEDMMFGLDVENVLMLGQDIDKIQKVPVEEHGLCGVIKFQGMVVPVLDFARRVGGKSGFDTRNNLIDLLNQQERQHIEWTQVLEHSLKNGEAFNQALDADECQSGQWLQQFNGRDETLKELIAAFGEPHQQLHAIGANALKQGQKSDTQQAAEPFSQQAQVILQKIRVLSKRAKEQIESDMRQVLLFVTDDGKTPRYALLIDEINDVLSYADSEFQSSSSGALAQIRKIGDILTGIYTRDNMPDCLFFDIDKLVDDNTAIA
ncbi:chemotaxis protein CheW [Methylophaga sp. OBS4]|uniref:chemotaxis protein CheW n=1 Tax=Methylophaga sp. OBS4 TaxID=2991935 RepID=UPI002259C188|nr:chemotaxis protein CheW [Methylophaga sp. OBS4]MCX4188614.1 chemotaxis protein CheW [Methylophaga sp. OBS4]